MPKATLIKDNQRVAVDVGSQQAKDYFSKGFKLETTPNPSVAGSGSPAGDLSGTMNELPSVSDNTAEFSNFRNLLTDMTRKAYENKPSIKDALAQFNTAVGVGAGVVGPSISGAVLDAEKNRKLDNVGDIFTKTMNTINSMEKIKSQQIENVNTLMGNLATAGLLDQLTGKEFEAIRTTGILPMETLQKISAKVQEIKNKPSYSEQVAGLEKGYANINGVPVKTDGTYDPITGALTDQSKVLSAGKKAYNFTSYAEDPNWGNAVNTILISLPEFTTNEEVNRYIQSKAPGSLLKAEDIESAAEQTGVSPELLLSIAAHESSFGNSAVAKANNNLVGYSNAGETGTNRPASEGGTYTKFATPKDSLMALANNIKQREIDLSGAGKTLTEEQKLAAKTLSTELFGKVAGTKDVNVSLIEKQLLEGKTIDEIRDAMRVGNQSALFTGVIRDAAEAISTRIEGDKKIENFVNSLDRSLGEGNEKRAKELIKNTAIDSYGVDEAKQLRGKERTIQFIEEIQQDLKDYEEKGGKTNIFEGSIEKIAGNVGAVKSPELRAIATKIATAVQQYRRSMSGVAFSVPESKEYKTIFPNIDKTKTFNSSVMESLKQTFAGDLDYSLSNSMGSEAYRKLFKNEEISVGSSGTTSSGLKFTIE